MTLYWTHFSRLILFNQLTLFYRLAYMMLKNCYQRISLNAQMALIAKLGLFARLNTWKKIVIE